jgi:hypothetical protein
MSKPSPKKQQRRNKRKKTELARQKRFADRKAAVRQFPEIVVDVDDAPAPLAAAIRQAVKRIRFENERLIAPETLFVYRRARNFGFSSVWADMRQFIRDSQEEFPEVTDPAAAEQFIYDYLGNVLYSLIPEGLRQSYLTFNFIIVACGVPFDDTILVRVRSLCREKTPDGSVYYSPHRPTLETDRGPKIVAFSTHALMRTCERTVIDWDTHAGNCDAVGFIIMCDYFERCDLAGADYAFTFFNECRKIDATFGDYAQAILDSPDDKQMYYYRVGYCPAVMEGDFLVAKTLLLPGMKNTPEYDRVLRRQAQSHDEMLALRKRVNGLTLKNLVETHDFSLLRQFHQAGIPQVVSFSHDILRFDAIL